MKTLDDIEETEMTGKELINKGDSLMSYDGELCLPEGQRTRQNINGEGLLTLSGAKVFGRAVLANLRGVRDVKIVHADSGYDVYALSN